MIGIILFVVFLVIDYFIMGVCLAGWALFMGALDKFEAKEKNTPALFTVLEQHNDGWLWYHPGWTFESKKQAKNYIIERRQDDFWKNRLFVIIKHTVPFPQESSRCTKDFIHYHFAGGKRFELPKYSLVEPEE